MPKLYISIDFYKNNSLIYATDRAYCLIMRAPATRLALRHLGDDNFKAIRICGTILKKIKVLSLKHRYDL